MKPRSINVLQGSTAFYTWVLALLLLITLGLYAVIIRYTKFEEAMGGSQWVPWGILVSTYVFFAVSSTGLALVSSFGHVFGIKKYELIGKRAALLAIITLISAFISIGVELEYPLRLPIYFILSPNFSSAIWWMGFWYSLSLIFKIGEFWFLTIVSNARLAKISGTGSLLFGVAGISTLGAVFGLVPSRTLWYGPYLPIYFILSAFVSGAALLAFVTIGAHWATKKEMSAEMRELMLDLGKLLAFFLVVNIFFVVWKIIASIYGHVPGKYESTMFLLKGPLSLGFWGFEIILGALIPLFLLLYPKRTVKRVFAASFLVVVGIFMMRYDFMIAGQLFPVLGGLHYAIYAPSYVETLIVIGTVAFCALMYTLGEKFLPLEETEVGVLEGRKYIPEGLRIDILRKK
jgi:molybdopterin-containing oxidoreductase family membrane subunit